MGLAGACSESVKTLFVARFAGSPKDTALPRRRAPVGRNGDGFRGSFPDCLEAVWDEQGERSGSVKKCDVFLVWMLLGLRRARPGLQGARALHRDPERPRSVVGELPGGFSQIV